MTEERSRLEQTREAAEKIADGQFDDPSFIVARVAESILSDLNIGLDIELSLKNK